MIVHEMCTHFYISVVIVWIVAIMNVDAVRVQEIEAHDDRQDKDAQSENHSRHAPALGLSRRLQCSVVVPLPV